MAQMFNPSQALAYQNPDILELNRQRKLADLLTSQGSQTPQGQTVAGGVYVPPNPMEYIGKLFNTYIGTKANEVLDTKEQAIAKAIREKGARDIEDVMTLAGGRKELPSETLAGPAYNGVAPSIQYPEIKANPREALARALLSENPQVQAVAPMLASEAFPKTPEKVALYKFAQTPEGGNYKGSFNDFENQMTAYQKAHLGILAANQAQSRVPMGYRMKQDGTLEAIPGGPADQKAQTVNAGRETVDTLVSGLKNQYDKLLETGGITSKNQSSLSNAPAYIASTGFGQTLGKTFGTENQSARNTIAQSRPLLLQAIAKATGMSAKQMDSNAELQMYLKAATDPSLDYESNVYALNQLQSLYGLGGTAPTTGALPSASDIDAEIARRKQGKK